MSLHLTTLCLACEFVYWVGWEKLPAVFSILPSCTLSGLRINKSWTQQLIAVDLNVFPSFIISSFFQTVIDLSIPMLFRHSILFSIRIQINSSFVMFHLPRFNKIPLILHVFHWTEHGNSLVQLVPGTSAHISVSISVELQTISLRSGIKYWTTERVGEFKVAAWALSGWAKQASPKTALRIQTVCMPTPPWDLSPWDVNSGGERSHEIAHMWPWSSLLRYSIFYWADASTKEISRSSGGCDLCVFLSGRDLHPNPERWICLLRN